MLRHFQLTTFVLISFSANALIYGDAMLTITEVNAGVRFDVTGSLDLAAFNSQGTAGGGGNSFDARFVSGLGTVSRITTVGLAAGFYAFSNFQAFTPIGTLPSSQPDVTLSAAPGFHFGYNDENGSYPGVRDSIRVPTGYQSGLKLNRSYWEPQTTFAALGLSSGQLWGVEFPNSTGGTQSIIFKVVPEPGLSILLVAAIIPLTRWRRNAAYQ